MNYAFDMHIYEYRIQRAFVFLFADSSILSIIKIIIIASTWKVSVYFVVVSVFCFSFSARLFCIRLSLCDIIEARTPHTTVAWISIEHISITEDRNVWNSTQRQTTTSRRQSRDIFYLLPICWHGLDIMYLRLLFLATQRTLTIHAARRYSDSQLFIYVLFLSSGLWLHNKGFFIAVYSNLESILASVLNSL